jgi:hypothetical protein
MIIITCMETAAAQLCGTQCQQVVQLVWVLKMRPDQCKLSYGTDNKGWGTDFEPDP